MKKTLFLLILWLAFFFLPAQAEEQKDAAVSGTQKEEVVTRTYSLRHVSPQLVKESLHVYFYTISFGEGSSLMSVRLPKANVATFEQEMRRLDVPKKNVQLRIFTVIAAKQGKSEPIANKQLREVLAEVSNLLSFQSYVLDGASVITLKDGARFGKLVLSSDTLDNLCLEFSRVSLATAVEGQRAVRMLLNLEQKGGAGQLLQTETEVAEHGYLVAGVSQIGGGGKSLVLVINAEIK